MHLFKLSVLVILGAVVLGATMAVVMPQAARDRVALASSGPEPGDPDAGQPFQANVTLSIPGPETLGSFAVPVNRRLVIEQIAVRAATPAGDMTAKFEALGTAGPTVFGGWLVLTPQGTFISHRYFYGLHHVRIYARPGSLVRVRASRNNLTGSGFADFSFSGYLLSPPA
jgi:hypothetical protein